MGQMWVGHVGAADWARAGPMAAFVTPTDLARVDGRTRRTSERPSEGLEVPGGVGSATFVQADRGLAILDPELLQDRRDVRAHGDRRDEQPSRDLGGGEAVAEQLEDLPLP